MTDSRLKLEKLFFFSMISGLCGSILFSLGLQLDPLSEKSPLISFAYSLTRGYKWEIFLTLEKFP